ncbi:Fur family transcriptional regulator [Bacteroides zoogleoformans]|uniref:Transcriptional repressor n=1 Tax=Bacteroides zoogleoformans TaxID=28119 RepID=A0ABM6TBF0_9BACE|nr:transcriptional repressor [Bacteroides zoogleoformans]AVM54107.1 transcriptional repressor [Bacteroides zoogleoformans]
MEEERCLDLLAKREISPTAIRLLVLQAMLQADRSVSLLDLENMLDTVDKSTIFRTIMLFLSHHLIHSIDDGTGSFKYAVCSSSCSCEVNDLHTHFHCEKCNKTFCFTNIPTPIVKLPEGFTLNSINYVLKGLCPECAATEDKGAHPRR